VHGDPLPGIVGGHAGEELPRALAAPPVSGRDVRTTRGQRAARGAADLRVPPVTRTTRSRTVLPSRVGWGCPDAVMAGSHLCHRLRATSSARRSRPSTELAPLPETGHSGNSRLSRALTGHPDGSRRALLASLKQRRSKLCAETAHKPTVSSQHQLRQLSRGPHWRRQWPPHRLLTEFARCFSHKLFRLPKHALTSSGRLF
jgi:hypothetical protein